MRKHYRWVFFSGLIVLLLPFLGVPYGWKVVIEFIVGIGLITLAFIEKQMFVYTEPSDFPSDLDVDNEMQESMFEEAEKPEDSIDNDNSEDEKEEKENK